MLLMEFLYKAIQKLCAEAITPHGNCQRHNPGQHILYPPRVELICGLNPILLVPSVEPCLLKQNPHSLVCTAEV